MITVVVGPKGCGKTRNAKLIAEKLGCKVIVDEGIQGLIEAKRMLETYDDVLYLTNEIQNVTGEERHVKAIIPYHSLGLPS
jgi:cytidylate kinase